MKWSILLILSAGPVLADTCPAAPDHSDVLGELIHATQQAPNEMIARQSAFEMWTYWADAPDDYAQTLLDEGMDRLRSYDFDGSLIALDALVDYCPEYAEGYNQRAYVNYLRQDYDAALPDLDRAIELSPQHVAAIAGQALTLVKLDRKGEAALALRAALRLNPWLSERRLLPILEENEDAL